MSKLSEILLISSCFTMCIGDLKKYDLELEDECFSPKTNQSGICMYFNMCASADTVEGLTICSFDLRTPIICCPTNESKSLAKIRRISDIKCDEYRTERFKLQTFMEIVPSIRMRTTTVEYIHVEGDPVFITAGEPVLIMASQPHMARIGWNSRSSIIFHCGGSLISQSFVITAAHCKKNSEGKQTNIVRFNRDGGLFEDRDVKRLIMHNDFNYRTKHNDIALIELAKNIDISKGIVPACLSQNEEAENVQVTVLGYGKTSFLGHESESTGLQIANLVTMDAESCSEYYEDDEEIIDSQICAHDPEKKGQDTCQGDSGGPMQMLIFQSQGKIYTKLVGITSFGKFCGTSTPGVYTKVSSFLDWIERIVWPLSG